MSQKIVPLGNKTGRALDLDFQDIFALDWSQGETHFMHFFVRKHGITTFLHLHLHHIPIVCPKFNLSNY